ncbi:hypothetical protein vBEcoMWL3_gp257c [Escherichia phage vB_EcoM_WL-3]|nr:hypothetical protein vBEcoMWL3_gp257c [Escherichia phage vB_EcoM_WL-3]
MIISIPVHGYCSSIDIIQIKIWTTIHVIYFGSRLFSW